MGSDQIQQGGKPGGNAEGRGEPGANGSGGAGESILSTISQLESRFDDLRKLHEQTVRKEAQLEERRRALDGVEAIVRAQEASLNERKAEIESAQRDLSGEREAVRREREQLSQQSAQTAQSQQTLDERAAEIDESSRKLAALEVELAARESTLSDGLADLERQINSGRERDQNLAEREHVVGEHDRRVAERERKVGDDEKRLAGAEYKLTEQRQAFTRESESFGARERSLREREEQIAGREREVEELKKRFAEQAVRVAEREEQLTLAEQTLASRESSIQSAQAAWAERERQIAAREQAAAAAEKKAAGREAELHKQLQQCAERGASLAELEQVSAQKRRKLDEQAAGAEAARRNAEQQTKALEDLERDLAQREKQLDATRVEMERAEQEIAARQGQQSDDQARSRQELGALRAQLDEREHALVVAEEAIKERTAEVRRHAEKLERERVAVAEQSKTLASLSHGDSHGAAIYSGRQEQVQIQLGESNAKRAEVEMELAQARQEIARLSDEAQRANQAASAIREAARADSAGREQTSAALDAELAEARRAMRDLTERLAQAENRAANAAPDEELSQREAAIDDLAQRLEEATAVNKALREQMDRGPVPGDGNGVMDGGAAAAEEIARRDHAIQVLRERLEQAEAQCESLRMEMESGGGEASPARPSITRNPTVTEARRERLRRYKSLLQGQARKIVQAQSAIQKRHTDCEQVLSQRAKLSAVAADLSRREKKLESGKARVGASAALLYVVATLGILAVLSWQLARQVWPGTFVATAIIEADTNGRTANPTELSTWESFHSDLLQNPSLIEVAALRMSQRGLVEFGNPAELSAKLKKDMFQQSSEPGQITVELKNQGAERARLLLDTFVTALKSVSDASRDQRPDDLGVIIAQAAAAGKEPLFDQQLEHAGALLGGGALAAGLFGLVVWNRLARSKQKFEHAQAVEAALNEVDWMSMEQAMKRHTPAGQGGAEKPAAEKKRRKG